MSQTADLSKSFSPPNSDSGGSIKNDVHVTTLVHHHDDNSDKDLAAQYARHDLGPISPEMDRRLLWKADIFITSMMCWVYAVQFMDKTANSAGSIMGLITDLHMVGKDYSWVGSSFYLSYLIFEIPISLALQRYPLAKTTAIIIAAWGVVMACGGAAQNYAGFMTTRVILGILEGGITPSFLILTGQWYKRNEQYSRTLFWFGFNGLGTILANSIGYGLARNHHLSIAGWRILYIIFGVITVVTGIVFWFAIPDTPTGAWFLTEEEKLWQVERIRENKQGFGNRKFRWYQVKEVFIDPRTYLYFVIGFFAQLPNGGLTNFTALVLQGMGYKGDRALLMSMPGGAVEWVGCMVCALLFMKVLNNYRMIWAISGTLLSLMSTSLLAWGPNTSSQLAGLILYNWFAPVAFVAQLSLISSNSAGHTKKVLMGAILLIAYCTGNLVGPQTFKSSEAPSYHTAKVIMACGEVIVAVFQIALLLLNIWENRRRDRKDERLPPEIIDPEFADLTDFENPEFRYAI